MLRISYLATTLRQGTFQGISTSPNFHIRKLYVPETNVAEKRKKAVEKRKKRERRQPQRPDLEEETRIFNNNIISQQRPDLEEAARIFNNNIIDRCHKPKKVYHRNYSQDNSDTDGWNSDNRGGWDYYDYYDND